MQIATDSKGRPIKAYSVQGYESGCIVFAICGAAARRKGAGQIGCDWEDIESCRREHWADEYAHEGHVPPLAMIEHGWWFECCNCGEKVCSDSCDDNDVPHQPVTDGDRVYCNQACLDAERQGRADAKAKRDAAENAATTKFPGVKVLWVGTRHGIDGTVVSFSFPGGQRSVDWTVGDDTALVYKTDLEAWKAYKESITAAGSAKEPA